MSDWICSCPACNGTLEPPDPGDGATRELLERVLGIVWDDGSASGLDGWIGPGRGSGEIDPEAVRSRRRAIEKAIKELLGDDDS